MKWSSNMIIMQVKATSPELNSSWSHFKQRIWYARQAISTKTPLLPLTIEWELKPCWRINQKTWNLIACKVCKQDHFMSDVKHGLNICITCKGNLKRDTTCSPVIQCIISTKVIFIFVILEETHVKLTAIQDGIILKKPKAQFCCQSD